MSEDMLCDTINVILQPGKTATETYHKIVINHTFQKRFQNSKINVLRNVCLIIKPVDRDLKQGKASVTGFSCHQGYSKYRCTKQSWVESMNQEIKCDS